MPLPYEMSTSVCLPALQYLPWYALQSMLGPAGVDCFHYSSGVLGRREQHFIGILDGMLLMLLGVAPFTYPLKTN
jgi:hypothetical protein